MASGKTQPSIAVVGTGYWGKNLVRNFHNLGVLHSVCDSQVDVAGAMLEQYPGVTQIDAYSDILQNSEIAGVAIATPAPTHGSFVREALYADKDVYVEKPLCLSEAEGAELTELARDRGRILMVGHLLWYHPAVLKLKELVATGELGRVEYLYSNRLNMGKLRREESVLWSFAPHDVSVILGLLDDMPESVQAQGGNFLHQQIADTTVSLLNFASGVRAHIFVSWLHPFKEQKLVVVGDRKMAVFDDTAPWSEKLQLYPHAVEWDGRVPVARKAERVYVDLRQAEPLREECRHFIECIESREKPRTNGEEGLRVLRVLNSCQQALEGHSRVELSKKESDCFVHETAVVDPGVEIGSGTKIWHFSHILSGSTVGGSCTIGQNVVIGPDVQIGNSCKIQNNVSVYTGVTLEDNVFCGPSMVFTNVMNPRSHVSRKHEFRETLVKKGTTIGANATVVCGNNLGKYSFIGAGAVVTQDVPDHALVVGNPARHIGWMCSCGEKLTDDLICVVCKQSYRENPTGLETVST
ncbi:MAG: Gfo/Idh/MocA family oxidoreductase [Rhodothermia bacterium]|nr:MAG: Gfo/Idh/MocA family oxidoreductase [Rhodothermia bacterium]